MLPFVEALRQGQWSEACRLRAPAPKGCADNYRRLFQGGEFRVLPPRAFQIGGRFTDNRRSFAIEVVRQGRDLIVYFENKPDGRVSLVTILPD